MAVRKGEKRLDTANHFAHLADDLIVLREAADVVFAPDLRAIDMDVKNAALAFDHLGVDAELVVNRLRQTGGSRVVVSLHAVFDADFHDVSWFWLMVIHRHTTPLV